MPSGRVHDRITVATAAASLPVWWIADPTRHWPAYVCGVCAYLFSGFLFSDDLDTGSLAYRRWGFLRFLWFPYRKLVPHRSWVSHGLAVGPLLRVVYFGLMVWLVLRCLLWLVGEYAFSINRDSILSQLGLAVLRVVSSNRTLAMDAAIGLILGGVAHSLADTVWSAAKKIW